jgi:hypothetical protein
MTESRSVERQKAKNGLSSKIQSGSYMIPVADAHTAVSFIRSQNPKIRRIGFPTLMLYSYAQIGI